MTAAGDLSRIVEGSARELLVAAVAAVMPDEWASASILLRTERDAIEAWLDGGGTAYGFTTLLGHLADCDGTDTAREADASRTEGALLQSHLVARTHLVAVGPIATRCIIGAKLIQFAHGGTGVGPEVHRSFVDGWHRARGLELPFEASYSCGDVVPGAWLVHHLVDPQRLRRGDVIASINGNHVSTGIAAFAFGLATDVAGALLSWIDAHGPAAVDPGRYQVPVSLRETTALLRVLEEALTDCNRALDRRLATPAANPAFAVDESGTVRARSTSGFLDYSLSSALIAVRTALLLGTHHVVALHSEIERAHGTDVSLTLQYPKVLQALQSRLVQRHGGGPPHLRPVGGGSDGLEDAADHSLHLALDVAGLASGVHGILDVAAEHVSRLGRETSVAHVVVGSRGHGPAIAPTLASIRTEGFPFAP